MDELELKLQASSFHDIIICACDTIEDSVESAVELFTPTLLSSAECMRKSITIGGSELSRYPRWYDQECRLAKREARKALETFRKIKSIVADDMYSRCRNSYKILVREKKSDYH